MQLLSTAPAPAQRSGFGREAPLLDGPQRRPNGFFQSMSDSELLSYARKRVREMRYSSRMEMKRDDSNLYRTLGERSMLQMLKFRKDEHRWKGKEDEEVLEMARRKMVRRGIASSTGIMEADAGLYHELWQRRLLGKLPLSPKKRKDRDWAPMGDDAVVSDNQRFIDCNGIRNKRALQDADVGRYNILYSRGLLGRVKFPEARRCWASKSDMQIIGEAERLIAERRLGSKSALKEADAGMYLALSKRKLLGRLALDGRRRDGGAGRKAVNSSPGEGELARRFVEWPQAEDRAERQRRERAFLAKWKAEAERIASGTKAPASSGDKSRYAIAGLYAAAARARSEKELRGILREEVVKAVAERASAERIGWAPKAQAERPGRPEAEESSALRIVLGELGACQRRIVELAFVKQKCDEDASSEMGMSVADFRQAKRAVVERMRQRLEGYV